MTEMEVENFKLQILTALKTMNPFKIILFGSMASGNYSEDSDFDIAIIMDIPEFPTNYEEKLALKMSIRKSLGNLSYKIPIDLIVFTLPEYAELKRLKTSFYQELEETGKVLYEKAG